LNPQSHPHHPPPPHYTHTHPPVTVHTHTPVTVHTHTPPSHSTHTHTPQSQYTYTYTPQSQYKPPFTHTHTVQAAHNCNIQHCKLESRPVSFILDPSEISVNLIQNGFGPWSMQTDLHTSTPIPMPIHTNLTITGVCS